MGKTYQQINKELTGKSFAPVYLLYGDEPFYIDQISEFIIEHALDETERAFNQIIAYGRDTSTGSLVNSCRQFPMMGGRQLIVLREAQDMDLKKEDNLKLLLSYCQHPQPETILVICHKYKAVPAKLLNALNKLATVTVFESKKKYESDIPAWISQQVQDDGYRISEKAAHMLTEYLGNDLEKIRNELGKLYISHDRAIPIAEDTIESNIGVSKDYNVFELLKAIAYRDEVKCHKIIHHFGNAPKENSIFKMLPLLFGYFNKILLAHSLPEKNENTIAAKLGLNFFQKKEYMAAIYNYSPAKAMAVIGYLREANTRVLGIENSTVSEEELWKELITKILKY